MQVQRCSAVVCGYLHHALCRLASTHAASPSRPFHHTKQDNATRSVTQRLLVLSALRLARSACLAEALLLAGRAHAGARYFWYIHKRRFVRPRLLYHGRTTLPGPNLQRLRGAVSVSARDRRPMPPPGRPLTDTRPRCSGNDNSTHLRLSAAQNAERSPSLRTNRSSLIVVSRCRSRTTVRVAETSSVSATASYPPYSFASRPISRNRHAHRGQLQLCTQTPAPYPGQYMVGSSCPVCLPHPVFCWPAVDTIVRQLLLRNQPFCANFHLSEHLSSSATSSAAILLLQSQASCLLPTSVTTWAWLVRVWVAISRTSHRWGKALVLYTSCYSSVSPEERLPYPSQVAHLTSCSTPLRAHYRLILAFGVHELASRLFLPGPDLESRLA